MKIHRNTLLAFKVATLFLAMLVIAMEVRILTSAHETILTPCAECKTAPLGKPVVSVKS